MRVLAFLVKLVVDVISIPLFFVILVPIALVGRISSRSRGKSNLKPRLLWGVTPIINIKYFSGCMKEAGYDSKTHVLQYYVINSREDFDYCRSDLFRIPLFGYVLWFAAPYFEFLGALTKFDIFHYHFDGGILGKTPLKFVEVELLHFAGKKVVVMVYGFDSYIYPKVRSPEVRDALEKQYPVDYRKIVRQVNYFSRKSDFVITGIMSPDGFERWDILPTTHLIVDTRKWEPSQEILVGEKVRFFHSPNHRGVKGTEHFIAAVERLKQEGHPVELVLVERVPNSEVRSLMETCDVVLDQLILFGYAMTALEAMACGKVVVCNISRPEYRAFFENDSYLKQCPVVSASISSVYEILLDIVKNRSKYADLGKTGRAFVERYHSFTAGKLMWERIYRKIWNGEDVDTKNYYHPTTGDFEKEIDAALNSRLEDSKPPVKAN